MKNLGSIAHGSDITEEESKKKKNWAVYPHGSDITEEKKIRQHILTLQTSRKKKRNYSLKKLDDEAGKT